MKLGCRRRPLAASTLGTLSLVIAREAADVVTLSEGVSASVANLAEELIQHCKGAVPRIDQDTGALVRAPLGGRSGDKRTELSEFIGDHLGWERVVSFESREVVMDDFREIYAVSGQVGQTSPLRDPVECPLDTAVATKIVAARGNRLSPQFSGTQFARAVLFLFPWTTRNKPRDCAAREAVSACSAAP